MRFTEKINKIVASGVEAFDTKIDGKSLFAVDFGFTEEQDAEATEVRLRWSYSMDLREYGIKALMPHVPDQTLAVTFRVDGQDIVKKIEAKNIEVELERDHQADSSLSLFPYRIEHHNGRWTVLFVI